MPALASPTCESPPRTKRLETGSGLSQTSYLITRVAAFSIRIFPLALPHTCTCTTRTFTRACLCAHTQTETHASVHRALLRARGAGHEPMQHIQRKQQPKQQCQQHHQQVHKMHSLSMCTHTSRVPCTLALQQPLLFQSVLWIFQSFLWVHWT